MDKERAKLYYQAHREEILERVKQNYWNNREEKLAYWKEYYELNKEEILKKNKIWYESHIEEHQQITRQWKLNNPEKTKEINRKAQMKRKRNNISKMTKTPTYTIEEFINNRGTKEWSITFHNTLEPEELKNKTFRLVLISTEEK